MLRWHEAALLERARGQTASDPNDLDSELRRPSVAQSALRRIQDMIRDGSLSADKPLPPQRELARTLKVSRASLREALSILATLGLVKIEPGRGCFVVGAEADAAMAAPRPDAWRFAAHYSPAEVYQFRYIAESHAAQLAAMHRTDAEMDQFQVNLEAFRRATRELDLVSSSQRDFEFHNLIMRFSRNRMLVDLHATYRHEVLESQRLPLSRRDRIWETVIEHERIVKALDRRDPDGAGRYMRVHIKRASERVGVPIIDLP